VQAQQGTLAYFDVQVKNHPLHRPMQKYLSDKLDKKNEAIVETNKSKEGMRAEGDKWVGDLRKVRELIRRIQHKVFVCAQCRQKFVNYNRLEIHKKMSEGHRLNGLVQGWMGGGENRQHRRRSLLLCSRTVYLQTPLIPSTLHYSIVPEDDYQANNNNNNYIDILPPFPKSSLPFNFK
jgi:hypothetical protein